MENYKCYGIENFHISLLTCFLENKIWFYISCCYKRRIKLIFRGRQIFKILGKTFELKHAFSFRKLQLHTAIASKWIIFIDFSYAPNEGQKILKFLFFLLHNHGIWITERLNASSVENDAIFKAVLKSKVTTL